MSRYQTHVYENITTAELRLEKHTLKGQGLADFYANAQITAEGLDGGSFSVLYRVPEGETWREHIMGATEADVAMLAGHRGPLAEALLIRFNNLGPAAAPRVVVNLWGRH
jgi:hypothetical protein